MAVKLPHEQVDSATMALMFIRALLQDTDPEINKGHLKDPCPVAYWEDSVFLDNEILRPVEGKSNANKK